MRFIEVNCPECGDIKISFDSDMKAHLISCPLCGREVKVIKINGGDING